LRSTSARGTRRRPRSIGITAGTVVGKWLIVFAPTAGKVKGKNLVLWNRKDEAMKPKYFWIKERHNPQLGVRYKACGMLPIKKAMAMEESLYGTNYMLRFASEDEYKAKCIELNATE
jgi:hypothetical protein